MGALIVALYLYYRERLWGSKFGRGNLGVAATYWIFAFLGTILVVASAIFYVKYKVDALNGGASSSDFFKLFSIMGAYSAPSTAAVVVLLYQITVIVSVWRATAKSYVSFWVRWLTRYALFFNAGIVALVFSFAAVGLALGAVLFLIARYFFLKKKAEVKSVVSKPELTRRSSALALEERVADFATGHVEIVLGELSPGEPKLEEYLNFLRCSGDLAKRIHVAPEIPQEKLKHPASRKLLSNQRVLLLIDDSDGLTGEKGVLATDLVFNFNPYQGESSSYAYKLRLIDFEVKGTSVSRMGEECISFRKIDPDSVSKIFMLINSYFADLQAWCEVNAHNGDKEAQFKLSMYASEESERKSWLRAAAEQGHAIAQGNLGAYLNSSNLEESYYWLSLAAAQGNENALRRLSSAEYDRFR